MLIFNQVVVQIFHFLQLNAMSGYGFGSSVDNSDASSVGVSNQLLPSFKDNVSISNPSTWHNLLFFVAGVHRYNGTLIEPDSRV